MPAHRVAAARRDEQLYLFTDSTHSHTPSTHTQNEKDLILTVDIDIGLLRAHPHDSQYTVAPRRRPLCVIAYTAMIPEAAPEVHGVPMWERLEFVHTILGNSLASVPPSVPSVPSSPQQKDDETSNMAARLVHSSSCFHS